MQVVSGIGIFDIIKSNYQTYLRKLFALLKMTITIK